MLMGCFPGEQKIQDSPSCRRFVPRLIGKSTEVVFANTPTIRRIPFLTNRVLWYFVVL